MRICEWCEQPIPPAARRDAKTCSVECRQAKQRFRIAPAGAVRDRARVFGYADPPYPGLSKRYYEEHPAYGGEVDHRELVDRMCRDFPDGWALSTSAEAMQFVLKLCPDDVRVAIWVKGSRKGVSYRARNAYEPVIIRGGRPRKMGPDEDLDDTLLWGGRQHSFPGALVGMKPAPFSEWMFRQLGAAEGDTLHDLFPGSGAVGRAWSLYVRGPVVSPQLALFPELEASHPTSDATGVPSRLEEANEAAADRLRPQLRLV